MGGAIYFMTGGVLESRQVKNSVKEKSSGHDLFILEVNWYLRI